MILTVIGGDARIGMLAESAADDLDRVICAGLDSFPFGSSCLLTDDIPSAIKCADAVILPLPVSRDGMTLFAPYSAADIPLDLIASAVPHGMPVLCGKISREMRERLEARGAVVTDYFEREELNILNAVATAEGAVETVMRNTDITVFESRVLVVGHGRVGRVTAEKFACLGAEVTVSARKKSDLAWIREKGLRAVRTECIHSIISEFDTVINTVPAPVIGERELGLAKDGCLFVELASPPYGIDLEAAKKLGVNALLAASLPGKVAPRSAANILYETVCGILDEI